jgi:hypothetical protein
MDSIFVTQIVSKNPSLLVTEEQIIGFLPEAERLA